MSAPNEITILLVLRGLLARADGSRAELSLWKRTRPSDEKSLSEWVEEAAGLGNRLRGPVWVLTDDAFSQVIQVASGAVKDLGEAELAKALAMEAQILSGIPAKDSVVAWRPLAGGGGHDAEFWVTQMLRSERNQVDEAVRRLGGRLAGIGPAEFVLATGRPAPVPLEPAKRIQLDDDEALRGWLAEWAKVCSQRNAPIPIVPPLERPMPPTSRAAIAASFLAIVAVLCALHSGALRAERTALQEQLARAQEPARRFEETQKRLAAMEKEVGRLRGAGTRSWSRLPARVMEAVSVRCPGALVVEGLEAGWDRSIVRGVCLQPAVADELASGLAEELATDDFRVSPPLKRLRKDGSSAGLYEFQIEIASPTPAGVAASSAPHP